MIERPSFIVTGASASGKTTLMKEAQDVGYRYLPTHTTRQKRPNEQDGIDDIFLSREDFEDNFSGGGVFRAIARLCGIKVFRRLLWDTDKLDK